MDTSEVKEILAEIGLSPAEIAVYVALLDGAGSVQEILKRSGEKRPTAYYCLGSLEKRGLVSKTGKEYGNKFQLEPVSKLVEIVDNSIRRQQTLLENAKKLDRYYPKNADNSKALVSYFDNFDSIRSAIFNSLYGKGKTIRSIVPANNLFHEIGKEFVKEYVLEKKKRKITTRALWEDIPSKKIISEYYANALVRQLPLDMHNSFETTMFLYDDKTLYVSPKKENFAVLIQSRDHAKMMTAMFEHAWNNAIDII